MTGHVLKRAQKRTNQSHSRLERILSKIETNFDNHAKAISLPWWGVQLIAWFIFCVLSFLSLTLWYGNARWVHVVHIALQALSGALITWPLAYMLRFANTGSVVRRILLHLIVVGIVAFLWNVFRMATFDWMITAADIWQDFGGWYFTALLIFGLWAALYYAIQAYSAIAVERARAMDERLRRVEAENLSREAEMKMLRYQLNPHFLFNTLNSISALVRTNRSEKARKMISQLSHFLRLSLENEGMVDVSLREEIETLQLYLDIEKVRYGPRLITEFDVDEDVMDAQIPALILQPLFENALQYAVAGQVAGGIIRLRGHSQDGQLHLSIEDTGAHSQQQSFNPAVIEKGVGLNNTESRMAAHYRRAGQVAYSLSDMGGLCVTLSFPYVPMKSLASTVATP